MTQLKRRHELLSILLDGFNEGRSKGLYCLAANLLPIRVLEDAVQSVGAMRSEDATERAKRMKAILNQKAAELNIALVLRK